MHTFVVLVLNRSKKKQNVGRSKVFPRFARINRIDFPVSLRSPTPHQMNVRVKLPKWLTQPAAAALADRTEKDESKCASSTVEYREFSTPKILFAPLHSFTTTDNDADDDDVDVLSGFDRKQHFPPWLRFCDKPNFRAPTLLWSSAFIEGDSQSGRRQLKGRTDVFKFCALMCA